MSQTALKFLPTKLQTAFARHAAPESERSLLAMLDGNPAFIHYWDDFIGASAGAWPASQKWSYPATVGTNTEAISQTTAALGGALTLTTSATSGDSAVQAVGLHWRGTEGYYALFRAKMNSIASAKFEVGMIDAVTRDQNINAKATPTFISTDGACFIFDTTDDTNLTFITVNNGVVGANIDVANFTMDTNNHIFEIVGRGGQVRGFVDGRDIGGGAITSTTPLSPYAASVTRTAGAKTILVDYMGCVGPRSDS